MAISSVVVLLIYPLLVLAEGVINKCGCAVDRRVFVPVEE